VPMLPTLLKWLTCSSELFEFKCRFAFGVFLMFLATIIGLFVDELANVLNVVKLAELDVFLISVEDDDDEVEFVKLLFVLDLL
jgi:hypothetical protein